MPFVTKSALMLGNMASGEWPDSGQWFQLQSSAAIERSSEAAVTDVRLFTYDANRAGQRTYADVLLSFRKHVSGEHNPSGECGDE